MGTLIGRFYEAIRSGGPPPVEPEQGAEVVRVTERIWRELGDDPSGGRQMRRAGMEV
jgi:hypothetical protein